MKYLTRITAFSFFLTLLSFFVAVQPARAVGILDWYEAFKNPDKSVTNLVEGRWDSFQNGGASLESYAPSFRVVSNTDWFLELSGFDEDSAAAAGMSEEKIAFAKAEYGDGLIGKTTQAIAFLYTPPASGTTYMADLFRSAHIIPQAQAQGLGFASLDPVLEAWKVFRNVAYFFFVVVFLVIGFMIMFRQKINGQTVVTAQQAIPGIIISLIFVTFSYAIAGFLIDLMYLLMYLMIGLFNPQGGTELMSKNFLQLGWDVVTGVNNNGAFQSMNEAVKTFAESVDTSTVGDVLGWIGGVTLGLIVSVAVLIGVFKLFFELLKTYITIIISIVVAPLLLMMGAIPGKNNFGYWIKLVFGNLLAFPMVLFSLILYELFTKGDLSVGGFVPPYLVGRGSGSVIMTLVGIGIIMIIPELITEMKKGLGISGGIWETLAFKAVDQGKEGIRYGIPAATVTGGALKDAGTAIYSNRKNPATIPTQIWRNVSGNFAGNLQKGNEVARGFEDIVEGKWKDPNSLENIMLRNQAAEATKKREEEIARKRRARARVRPNG